MNGKHALFHTMASVPRPRGTIVTALMVVMGMALLGAMFASTVDAAPIKTKASISSRVQSQRDLCEIGGGQIKVDYGYKDGKLDSAQTVCNGGSDDGRVCSNTTTTYDCYTVGKFVRPTESVVPGQRPDTAAPVENPAQTLPVVDDRVVAPGGVAEDPTEDEQARIVDPAEVCEALGGTPNVIEQGSTIPAEIRCTGGALDRMICYGTICDYFRSSTGSEEDPNAPPSGGIVFVEEVSLDDLDHGTGDSVTPDMAEDPTAGETVVVANQVGDPVFTGTWAVQLCGAFGGTPNVNEPRTVGGGLESVTVFCRGGMLDGIVCAHEVGSSAFCYDSRPRRGAQATVPPGPGEELEGARGAGVAPGVAEDPTRTDTVVIANQSGSPVDNAAVLAAMCNVVGGMATVEEARTVGRGLENVTVSCKGGLLDGMACEHGVTYNVCFFRAVPPEDSRVTPAAGVEVPAESVAPQPPTEAPVMPTAAATEVPLAPSEPTAVPTDVPVEPTAAPTEEPVLPTVPTDDNTAPPGEAEDPTQIEPTPTEVVLL